MTSPDHPDSGETAQREERWLAERLAALDHAVPPVTVASIRARAMRPVRSWPRIAAGIALALGAAGVAYAAPGSPLPQVVSRLVHLVAGGREAAPPARTRDEVAPSGISVPPGERLTVSVNARSGDTAIVSLSLGSEVMVRVTGGGASFTAEAHRLLVEREGAPARIEVLVPRTALWVTLAVGDSTLWLKRGTRIQSPAEPDARGHYRLPLKESR